MGVRFNLVHNEGDRARIFYKGYSLFDICFLRINGSRTRREAVFKIDGYFNRREICLNALDGMFSLEYFVKVGVKKTRHPKDRVVIDYEVPYGYGVCRIRDG